MPITQQELMDVAKGVENRLIQERQPVDHESGRIKSEVHGSGPIRTIVAHAIRELEAQGYVVRKLDEELEEEISEAISDSLEMDWVAADGARYVMAMLRREA